MTKVRSLLKYLPLLLIPVAIFFFDYFKKEEVILNSLQEIKNTESTTDNSEEKITPQPNKPEAVKETESTHEIKHIAWIPAWDMKEGVNSFKKDPKKFSAISPVWYSLKPDGSLTKSLNHKTELVQIAKSNGVKVVPSIASFDFTIIKGMLQSSENYSRYISEVTAIANDPDVDGIDLDYESIEREDKDAFFKMLRDMSKMLKERNKTLSVTVLPKWGDNIRYSSLQQTRDVQDWTEIGRIADEVRVMTYDYTSQRSPIPGPIAPTPWIENVIKYGVTKVPSNKLYVGIHLYGYEWVNKNYDPNANTLEVELETSVQSNSYSYRTIRQILADPSTKTTYDQIFDEGIATYDCLETSKCILFYPTLESVKERIQLAEKYKIAGVAYWKLGREEDILNY